MPDNEIEILLGMNTKIISQHIATLEEGGELVPTRRKQKDIYFGVSH